MCEKGVSRLAIASKDEEGFPPGRLSYSEELLWLSGQNRIKMPVFIECPLHLSLVVRLRGRLDERALRKSLDEIVRRHSVLRCRFPEGEGGPVRVIEPHSGVRLPRHDLTSAAQAERSRRTERLLDEHVSAAFDLQQGPLLRALLLRVDSDAHILAVTVHHIVFDGRSRQVLARELSALYAHFKGDEQQALEDPPAQYPDYARWQRQRLDQAALARLTRAWKSRLAGADAAGLGDQRLEASAQEVASCRFALSEQRTAALKDLSRHQAVTPAIGLFSLYCLFLHKIGGPRDLLVGLPLSDRRRREFEDLIGLFTNVMVVRADMSGDPDFLSLLKRLRTALQQAYGQQELPYWHFLSQRQEGQAAESPYRFVFNYMNRAPAIALELPDLRAEILDVGNRPPGLADLSLFVQDAGETLSCRLWSKPGLFTSGQVKRLAEQFQELTSLVADLPAHRLSDYMLSTS